MEQTLRAALSEWLDVESAMYWLAVSLGLMRDEPGLYQTRAKHVFASANPIGDMLYHMLEQLVVVGVLERRDESDIEYRWSPSFRGSWETAA